MNAQSFQVALDERPFRPFTLRTASGSRTRSLPLCYPFSVKTPSNHVEFCRGQQEVRETVKP
jgi:hypothetical protein